MKLLIVTHIIPYPLSDGGKISQFAVIDYLRNKCSLALIIFTYNDFDYHSAEDLKNLWENVNIEVIDLRVQNVLKEEPTIKVTLKKALKKFSYRVKRVPQKIFQPVKKYVPDIKELQSTHIKNLVGFCKPREKKVIDQFIKIVDSVKPDILQFEFVDVLDLSLCIPPELTKIFIHHELRFRRIETEFTLQNQKLSPYGSYMKKFSEISELGLLTNFDAIITFSEVDKELLSNKLPNKNIISSPFPILNSEFSEFKSTNLETKKIIFIGSEYHSPNKDGIEWYIKSMSKAIFEKCGLTLHIIGNWSNEFKSKYSNNAGIYFPGFVEDLGKYCVNSIMIVPLRIGSGIRTKILYAMAWGIPVIATTLGKEGIHDNENIFLTADNPKEFIDAIVKIITDASLGINLVRKAQVVLMEHYSQEAVGNKRLQVYESVLQNKKLQEL